MQPPQFACRSDSTCSRKASSGLVGTRRLGDNPVPGTKDQSAGAPRPADRPSTVQSGSGGRGIEVTIYHEREEASQRTIGRKRLSSCPAAGEWKSRTCGRPDRPAPTGRVVEVFPNLSVMASASPHANRIDTGIPDRHWRRGEPERRRPRNRFPRLPHRSAGPGICSVHRGDRGIPPPGAACQPANVVLPQLEGEKRPAVSSWNCCIRGEFRYCMAQPETLIGFGPTLLPVLAR